jgi:ammonia channel protein AmtB
VLRLWVPWAMFQSGSDTDGTAKLAAGNAAFYLIYLLCLCAAAALVAIWHDKAARTGRLRGAIAGVVIVGLAALTLAMTTGPDHVRTSKAIPYKIDKG